MKRCHLLVYLASEESKPLEGKFFLHWKPADQCKKEPLQHLHTTWAVFCVCNCSVSGHVQSLADESRVLLDGVSSQLSDNAYICATSVDVGVIEKY